MKKALQFWLHSQTEPGMIAQQEQRLLRSLDEAMRDLDAPKDVSLEESRWTDCATGDGARGEPEL
jgi:hypothetical protein